MTTALALVPGAVLAQYRLLRPLHVGTSSQVFLAQTLDGTAEVALKISAANNGDLTARDRLMREAEVMRRLEHPNVVRTLDSGRVGQAAFVVLEYVRGESLQELLRTAARKGRGIQLSNALFIVKSVADGLDYAHNVCLPSGTPLGLVHRDVSPTNVMIRHDGRVQLIDFGIARQEQSPSEPTAPGTLKGNLRYMSPEQCTHHAVDARSDIFALGIVLFELSTGTRWLRERDDFRAIKLMLTGKLPRPSERRTGYPPELERIVLRALQLDPAKRFESAQEFSAALMRFSDETGLTLSEEGLRASLATSEGMQALGSPEARLSPTASTIKLQR